LERPERKNAEFRLEGRELNIALNEELFFHLRSKYTAVEIFLGVIRTLSQEVDTLDLDSHFCNSFFHWKCVLEQQLSNCFVVCWIPLQPSFAW